MFLTKKYIPRRTFLRGVGVTLSLPFLDSMVPAQTPLARTAASPRTRLACIYVPHGAVMDLWTPTGEGTQFDLPEILKPLEKLKDQINIISNLAHSQASGEGNDAGADHARSAAVFLSGVRPERGTQVRVGTSVDQLAAQRIGQDTPLPSIELCIEDVGSNCGAGYGCAYTNTISWRTPTTPLPMENNPQILFEKLFGDGGSDGERASNRSEDRSILDAITGEVATLKGSIPSADRSRLDEYLDNIREIERRIQKAEQKSATDLTMPPAPVGIPDSFDEHLKLMFDLEAIAFQSDVTRIATLMYARDLSAAAYPLSGVRDGFHTASHHSNIRSSMDRFAQINKYHIQTLTYFLEKLKSTKDGDGTLLDHSLVLYGSSMSNGNQHDHDPLPILLAGGASGRLKGGRHIKQPAHTPMSNLLLSVLDKLDVNETKFGDSTAPLAL